MLKKLTLIVVGFVMSMSIALSQEQQVDDTVQNEVVTRSTVITKTEGEMVMKSPPASAITPTINTSNSDLCTFGVAGAVQTQILGISMGSQVTDQNCERLKNAKTLYDMGMKVAAVSVMCQDKRVFDAMMDAGTPCPYDGMIGQSAKLAWEANVERQPGHKEKEEGLDEKDQTLLGGAGILSLLLLLLL